MLIGDRVWNIGNHWIENKPTAIPLALDNG